MSDSRFLKVARAPTCIDAIPEGASGVHESVFRSYALLELSTRWLSQGIPGPLVVGLLGEASAVADEIDYLQRSFDLLTKENERLSKELGEAQAKLALTRIEGGPGR